MRTRVLVTIFPILLAAATLPLLGEDRPAVGIVAGKQGNWTRASDRKNLQLGDEIFDGTTVQTDASARNFIKIAFFDGRPVWEKVCTVQKPCNGGS